MGDRELRILGVDDNEGCRELYRVWLGTEHAVETVSNGPEAMETLTGQVDIVLLDRDMPGPSGVAVARDIAESAYDPFVVMVSSRAADVDIVEFPIDGYLQKPVGEAEIRDVVDQFEAQQAYQSALNEFFRLTAKVAAVEASDATDASATSEEYDRLTDRLAEQRAAVDEALAEARADWVATFKTCAGRTTDGRSASLPAE